MFCAKRFEYINVLILLIFMTKARCYKAETILQKSQPRFILH